MSRWILTLEVLILSWSLLVLVNNHRLERDNKLMLQMVERCLVEGGKL